MINATDQLIYAARWAARVSRNREKRVIRKFGAEAAPAILAEAARIIEAAWNSAPATLSPEEQARLAAQRAERDRRDKEQEAELMALVTDRARRAGEAAALRRRVLASLRRLGFRRETATSGQSAYYHHLETDTTVRISDHDVPLTNARESDVAHGGHTWALTDLSLVITDTTTAREAGEWLVAIRRKIRSQA